jgi:hypothetical protein
MRVGGLLSRLNTVDKTKKYTDLTWNPTPIPQ